MTADNLLSWEGEDGSQKCLLVVKDEDKQPNQSGYKKIELCIKEDEQWVTDEVLDYVGELQSFGIPPTFTD